MTSPNQTKLRIAFLGDSITLGDGDEEARGWPSRLLERTVHPPRRAQCYNLGVGGDRLINLARRWRHDLQTRLAGKTGCGVVIMIGVNDALCAARGNAPIPLDVQSWGGQLTNMVRSIAARVPVFLVGPAPVLHNFNSQDGARADDVNTYVAQLDAEMRKAGELCGISFATMAPLLTDRPFLAALAAVDGLHPAGRGYAAISSRLANKPAFGEFLSQCDNTYLTEDAWLSTE